MNRTHYLMIGSLILASCGQSGGNAANEAAASPPQPKKRPAYCFFKPEEMKGWAAKRGKDGNITIKGKGHVKDSRYKAIFGSSTITGTTIQISPTITTNTGYEAPDDWWDMSVAIPNSSGLNDVQISCGDKPVAEFSVPLKS
jgi:hypothetical protein